MIAKIPPKRKDGKSSFKELIDYIRGKDGERAVHVGFQGISSVESAAVEMETVAFANTRCKDPVFHFILSWRELEYPTKEQTDEAVKIALAELDLLNCQALWALQADTENRHVHVVVNRIDPETGRAVQPAGNWTYKALERAARKIEAAQGWEVLKEGRYEVTQNGGIKETSDECRGESERISQTALDIEAHTATKSAERIGKETAAPIIRAAKNWEELHEKLGERGIFFERKGSGAILRIGEAVIKASQVSRDMSLSKLEARLGEYRAAENLERTQTAPEAEPVERASQPKVRGGWEEYSKNRTAYFENKKKATAALQARQKQERASLQKEQKAEGAKLFEKSWRGKGRELNQRRSVMAAKQQAEKLDLRDRQKKEREKLRELFPLRFPNFKTWLEQEANPEFSVLFRYPDDPVMLGVNLAPGVGTSEFGDLRSFTAIFGNKGGVGYCRKAGAKKPDFVDYGKKILLSRNCDETAVLAALQLASQKWGTVQISGTESYKKLCAEVAAKHNIRISVMGAPIKSVVSLSPEERKVKDIGESRNIFERYAEAVGAERFRVVVTDFSQADGTRAFVFDKKTDGLEGKTREGILDSLPKLRQYEHYGKNVNVVPLSPDKHHVLIDDMNAGSLERLKQDGYRPACVIESSPGNFQAILTVPRLGGSPDKDREAANALTKDLNTRYGDPKLSGAIHAHRLPPFRNCKPKHRREDGTYPETRLAEAEGGICEKAVKELEEKRNRLARETEKLQREQEQRTRFSFIQDWSAGASDPNGAYRAHWRDVLEKLRGDVDYSRVDAMVGLRMRVTGYSAGQIYEAMKDNAAAMRKEAMNESEYAEKYRYRDWSRYAKETVEKYVFGPRGAAQYYKSEEYRAYYMKLENRNSAKEERSGQKASLSR